MSVHRLKDGRWIVKYQDKQTKKIKKEYFGRGLEAEQKARSRNESLDLRSWKRRTPKVNSHRFQVLANAYSEAKFGSIERSTYRNFLWKMEGVILPELGHLPAIQITPRRIDLYINKRLKTKKKNGDLIKRTTVHREITDIQAVLNWAVERRYLAFNPIEKYKKPKRDDAIILPPTESEIYKILDNSPDHLIRALYLGYYIGVRPGTELFNLTWNDVDLESQIILIRSARKGGRIARMVPIHPDFMELLEDWKIKDADDTACLIRWRNKPVKSVKKAFATAKKKAGITRRLPPYSFRHAFATMMLKRNADLKSTSELLGHTRIDTTARIYQHTDTQMHQEAIDRLPALNWVHKNGDQKESL